MKQTSRKKVLLSSVAMMMVATVSLGSATYAWFTNQTTATAKTMTVKANAAKGLKIKGDGDTTWQTDAKFKNAGTEGTDAVALNPISVLYDTQIREMHTATASSSHVLTATSQINSLPAFDGTPIKDNANYAVYTFEAAYTGEVAENESQYLYLKGLTIEDSADAAPAAAYARVAIIDNSDGSVKGVFDLTGEGTDALNGENSTDASDAFVAGVTTVTTTAQHAENINLKLSETALKNTSAENGHHSFSALVWFEGQDPECIDDNAGNTAKIEMFFEMKNA